MEKNILIVVDMQNDFVYGKFFTKQAQNIVKPIFQEINIETVPYDKIIFTKDTHEINEFVGNEELSSYEGRLFDMHCVGKADIDLVYPLNKTIENSNTTVGLKNSFDGSLRIENILQLCYPDTMTMFNFYICGVCTDICVLATAIGLTRLRETKSITVFTDLCAGTSPKAHKAAISAMKPFKINTTTIGKFRFEHRNDMEAEK